MLDALRDHLGDETYSTPIEPNNPMEPHACIAIWTDGGRPAVTLYDSTQGVHTVRQALARVFGLEPEQLRVISPHVGGGFGSKGAPHAHNVLAALAHSAPVAVRSSRRSPVSRCSRSSDTAPRPSSGCSWRQSRTDH
jgi:CO/xanthine dehydrogenase Mo-binding subunit